MQALLQDRKKKIYNVANILCMIKGPSLTLDLDFTEIAPYDLLFTTEKETKEQKEEIISLRMIHYITVCIEGEFSG